MSKNTKIVIAVVVVLLLGITTCGAGAAWWLGAKAKEIKQSIADGGLVLTSPPEVVSELAGAKKDYVGSWTSTSGKSSLDIKPSGELNLVADEHGGKETLTAPIGAFSGNDIEIKLGLVVKIAVTEPPHQTNGRWEMTAKGIHFQRPL